MSNKGQKVITAPAQARSIDTAVLLAEDFAGLLSPLCESVTSHPWLLPIGNVPIMYYTLSSLVSYGIKKIYIYTSKAEQISNFISLKSI